MNIPIYKFALRKDLKNDKRFLPTKAEPKATGWDVRAAMPDKNPLTIQPFQQVKIPLGIRSFCPEGWWYEIKPRSSTFTKKNLHALYGTVDETYEGELVFACQYIPQLDLIKLLYHDGMAEEAILTGIFDLAKDHTLEINFGDAIAQIIPVERKEMEVVEWTNEEYDEHCKTRAGARGAGGFGSTGK